MNTFEDLFEYQQKHQSQHLTRERQRQTTTTLLDDPSCIICYPASLPSEQSLRFRVFLKWARLILGARQYTSETITEFDIANSSTNSELQALNYRHVLYSFTYNTLPDYTLDKAVQLTIQAHRQTLAFNKDPGSRNSEYFETPIPSVPSSPSPRILTTTDMGPKRSTAEDIFPSSTAKPNVPPKALDEQTTGHSTYDDENEYQPDDVLTV
jgi:hypothetical protein